MTFFPTSKLGCREQLVAQGVEPLLGSRMQQGLLRDLDWKSWPLTEHKTYSIFIRLRIKTIIILSLTEHFPIPHFGFRHLRCSLAPTSTDPRHTARPRRRVAKDEGIEVLVSDHPDGDRLLRDAASHEPEVGLATETWGTLRCEDENNEAVGKGGVSQHLAVNLTK